MTEQHKEFEKDKRPPKLASDLANLSSELMTEAELIDYLRILDFACVQSKPHLPVAEHARRIKRRAVERPSWTGIAEDIVTSVELR